MENIAEIPTFCLLGVFLIVSSPFDCYYELLCRILFHLSLEMSPSQGTGLCLLLVSHTTSTLGSQAAFALDN